MKARPNGWVRSTACGGGNCVEVGRDGDHVLVRNSQRPDEVARFTAAEFSAFIAGAKAGEFDA